MRSQDQKKPQRSRCKGGGRAGEQGFTLIETTVALVVMLIAGLAATSLFFYSINYNSGANDRAIATAIAQQQVELLRNTPDFNDANLAATTGTTTQVIAAGRPYRVEKIITNTSATLKTITIRVTPQSAGPGWVRTPVIITTQRSALVTGTN